MHTVELSAGTIEYDAYGPAKGRSVVFVHGYAMGASLWRPLAQRLAEHNLRCFAPTWPLGGHRRAMRPAAELTMRGVAAMVDEFLTALDGLVRAGKVREIAYFGSYSTFIVDMPGGKTIKITEGNTARHETSRITWGDQVFFWWDDLAPVTLTQ